jgi:DNA-directed RNA polymerase specialized sigma24 family protein
VKPTIPARTSEAIERPEEPLTWPFPSLALAGHRAVCQALHELHGEKLWELMHQLARGQLHELDIADAYQDMWVVVLTGTDPVPLTADEQRAWLFTIYRYCMLKRIRYWQSRSKRLKQVDLVTDPPDRSDGSTVETRRTAATRTVHEALDRAGLTPDERRVIEAYLKIADSLDNRSKHRPLAQYLHRTHNSNLSSTDVKRLWRSGMAKLREYCRRLPVDRGETGASSHGRV